MGYLAGNLRWANLMAAMSDEPQAGFSWNFQTSTQERNTGGDFGVAFELEIENEKYFRLAFFQAKNGTPSEKNIQFSWNQVPPCYNDSKNPSKDFADNRLQKWIFYDQLDISQSDKTPQDHQIYRLAVTQEKGRTEQKKAVNNEALARMCHEAANWVHYVVWCKKDTKAVVNKADPDSSEAEKEIFEAHVPLVISLQDVKKGLSCLDENEFAKALSTTASTVPANLWKTLLTKSSPEEESPHLSFADFIAKGNLPTPNRDWLLLGAQDAQKLIGEFIRMGTEWFVIEGGGEHPLSFEQENDFIQNVIVSPKEFSDVTYKPDSPTSKMTI